MAKKEYIKPDVEIIEFETIPLMITTSGEIENAYVGSGSADNNTPDFVNKRRGKWGNLWSTIE